MSRIACIACGFSMVERGCKVRCPRCGVFYDCGDGMLPMPEGETAAPVETPRVD
ncbi:MAG: hypothetical protein R3F20_06795 [Planctomycetota bacterium]